MAQFKVDIVTLLNGLWLAVERLSAPPPTHGTLQEHLGRLVVARGGANASVALRSAAALLTWPTTSTEDSTLGQLLEGAGRAVARSAAGCGHPRCRADTAEVHDHDGVGTERWLIDPETLEGQRWRYFVAAVALAEAAMIRGEAFVIELDVGQARPWGSTPTPVEARGWVAELSWFQDASLWEGKVPGNSPIDFAKLLLAAREAAGVTDADDRLALAHAVGPWTDLEEKSALRAFDKKRVCPSGMKRLLTDLAEGRGGLKSLQLSIKRVLTTLGLHADTSTPAPEIHVHHSPPEGQMSSPEHLSKTAMLEAQATLCAHGVAYHVESSLAAEALLDWGSLKAAVDAQFTEAAQEATRLGGEVAQFTQQLAQELVRIGSLPALLASLVRQHDRPTANDLLAALEAAGPPVDATEDLSGHLCGCEACATTMARVNAELLTARQGVEAPAAAPTTEAQATPQPTPRPARPPLLAWLQSLFSPPMVMATCAALIAVGAWVMWPAQIEGPPLPAYEIADVSGAEGRLLGPDEPARAFTPRNQIRVVFRPLTRVDATALQAGAFIAKPQGALRRLPPEWLSKTARGAFVFEGPAQEVFGEGSGDYALLMVLSDDAAALTGLAGAPIDALEASGLVWSSSAVRYQEDDGR